MTTLFESAEGDHPKQTIATRLIWPSVQLSDAAQLGRQGLVLCLIAGLVPLIGGAITGHPVVAIMGLCFYGLGGLGVRQHSIMAALLVALICIGNAALAVSAANITTFIEFVMAALLLANVRVTYTAYAAALNKIRVDPTNSDGSSVSGGTADSHSGGLWRVARYFFVALFLVGAFRVVGRAVVLSVLQSAGTQQTKVEATAVTPSTTTDAHQPVTTPFVDTSDERKKDAQAVSSVCGWKALPQVAEYQIGMSLSEAQRLGGANLKCEQSSPITSGSGLDDKFLAPDSDISNSDDGNSVHGFARAAARCDTVVNGNDIDLWFFPSREGGPDLLGEAINGLDSSDIADQKEAIAKGISERYGVDIANRQQTCSNPSGVDADYAMDVSVTQPLCSIPSSPDLPPDAGCILMQDNALLRRGGTIIAQRDAAGVKAAESAAADNARQAADANRY